MQPIPNSNRSDSSGETSSQDRDITEAFTGKDYYQNLIGRANTVPFSKIFKHYGIRLDAHNRKTVCPFRSHKGGRENTASFLYYPDTNTYCCFGCRQGSRVVDFVSEMSNCSIAQAAVKILELFESDVDEDIAFDQNKFSERLEIMKKFSNIVREFYEIHETEEAYIYVEKACAKFDALNLKHEHLDNQALSRIIEQLEDYLKLYK